MTEIQDYPSRLDDPASRRFETFSYLPPMDDAALRRQVAYIVARGWSPAVEHCEPAHAMSHYWYLWELPLFGETDVDRILGECRRCRDANPGNLVRLIGYDSKRQTQGTAMLVFRPAA
ncbi:ribulose bisphosphate carboxylase small subunit [Pseudothauera rhizosphaerae]|uniref:Ribulose bisphosphate carboxylase small subunit n=1 Tax=Pseudothauera rhizosphaerae TaxID=2565932 RepID=A0A4S4AM48_9RHOO|nr:ribulose bisphosphate carboxylase small subunit [Pseudothauera rhizosphaerae]THF60638.1 ribulose bisphosphate carboxylase small subunit [Pseudothauera rhizosphaerae]